MKKAKILVVILIFILLGEISFLVFRNLKLNDDDVPTQIPGENIISYRNIDNSKIEVGDNYYIEKYNKSFQIYNWNNELLFSYEGDYEPDSMEVIDNKYVYFYNKNYYLYDFNNNLIFNEYTIPLCDEGTNKNYLFVNNKLYDYDLNVIYEIKENYIHYDIAVINDFIFISDYPLYDIKTKEETNIIVKDYFKLLDDYMIIIDNDDKYYLFDLNKRTIVDTYLENISNVEYKNNTSTIYVLDNKVYFEDIIFLDDNYKVNFSVCDKGAKLYLNNDAITDCHASYKVLSKNVFIVYDDADYALYVNGSEAARGIINVIDNYVFVSNYIVDRIVSDVYSLSGYKLTFKDEITNTGANFYVAHLEVEGKDYFTDKNLKKISDDYDFITCNNDWCYAKKDNLYELYYDGKLYFKDKFFDIELSDNYIVAKTLFQTFIMEIGEGNKLLLDIDKFNLDINIDDVIKAYKLDNIKDLIYENKELFEKYAYIVLNNNNLQNYKKYVMDVFEVVVKEKKYLNEDNILYNLNYLSIIEADDLGNNVGGLYQDNLKRISIKEASNRVIYHELMHFIDLNAGNKRVKIYKCNDKYTFDNGDNCEIVYIEYYNFLTETGAETLTTKYFTNIITSYKYGTVVLEAFEYLFGSDKVNTWFFDDGINKFYFDFLNLGYSREDIDNILKNLSKFTDVNNIQLDSAKEYAADLLVSLYSKIKGNNYKEDAVFLIMLDSLLRWDDNYKNNFNFENLLNFKQNIISSLKDNGIDNFLEYYIDILIINDIPHLSFHTYNNENNYFIVNYDFIKNKIVDINKKSFVYD